VSDPLINEDALNSARRKAYLRLIPLLFICYVVAYVDRVNVSIAKLTMQYDLPSFDNAVFGIGIGMFFWGYFILEIPGSVLVERWSARKWICRIMVSWGILASMTAFVHWRIPGFTHVAEIMQRGIVATAQPLTDSSWDWVANFARGTVNQLSGPDGLNVFQFYLVRFLLGLAEAGFFPGVIVYLTHWFPARDRTKALSYFFIGTPVAQIVSPKICNALLPIGNNGNPEFLGLEGWQWIYIVWGLPAVILGIVVLIYLTDRPAQAKWLTEEERTALENTLAADKAKQGAKKRMTLMQGLLNWKVLVLAAAYFCNVTANYGIEGFLPTILKEWYGITNNKVTWLIMLPPVIAICAQLFVGWNSDRVKERRLHAMVPLLIASVAVIVAPFTQGSIALTVACFMIAFGGLKGYLPAFWSLPNMFLAQTAAAGSIGFINSVGNLGGFFGNALMGILKEHTKTFESGLICLGLSIFSSAVIIFFLGLGKREQPSSGATVALPSGPTSTPAKA
jgi:MFS transporter, ACS family, tartrate transporter